MGKILILSIYPAPYRVELFQKIKEQFDADIFFENSGGDFRSADWFCAGNYYTLDSASGRKHYDEALNHFDDYSLVALYDYSTKEGVKLALRCILKKKPYVVNSDGVMLTDHGNFIKDCLKRFLLKDAVAFLASGENAKKYFLKYGAKQEKVYRHPFSTLHKEDILDTPLTPVEKNTLRKQLGLPAECKLCIAVGRFIPLKRYNELIAAWKEMPKDYCLLIIGGGEEKETYLRTINQFSLSNVLLEEFHPKEELMEYYKVADVFVHPTSYDVWGLVVNEAMACGLPVVVSDHCVAGLELVRNGENGYLIPMGNDKEMIKQILAVCENAENRFSMGKESLSTIRKYTIENMAGVHCNVLSRFL